jgi:hypothetical protein
MNALTHLVSRLNSRSRRLALLAALAGAAAGLASPGAALAQSTQFALTCIGTETGATINFQYRWGHSGEWSRASVEPGQWKALKWNYGYADERRSPQLFIRYDDDMSSGVHMVVQQVRTFAARESRCEAQGYMYNFRARSGELFLDDEERTASR